MKKLLYLFICTLTFGITACSDDNNDENNGTPTQPNYYSFEDKKITNIVYASYKNEAVGFSFFLSSKNPTADPWDSPEALIVQVPIELFNTKIDLINETSLNWEAFGQVNINNDKYYWQSGGWNLTRDDSWMKVTKNSEDNFTIEIDVEVKGKTVKAYYKGNFTNISN